MNSIITFKVSQYIIPTTYNDLLRVDLQKLEAGLLTNNYNQQNTDIYNSPNSYYDIESGISHKTSNYPFRPPFMPIDDPMHSSK